MALSTQNLCVLVLTSVFLCSGTSGLSVLEHLSKAAGADSVLPSLTCVLNCGVSFGDQWRSVFEGSEGKLISDAVAQGKLIHFLVQHTDNQTPDDQKNTFNNICDVYEEYSKCLSGCPQNLVSRTLQTGLDSLQLLCGEKREEYLSSLPCLAAQREKVGSECRSQEERVSLSSLVLHSSFVSSPRNLLAALRDFCSAALNHTQCVYPVLQGCGERTEQLVQGIWTESFQTVGRILSKVKIPLPKECSRALMTLAPKGRNNRESLSDEMNTTNGVNVTSDVIQTQIPAPPKKRDHHSLPGGGTSPKFPSPPSPRARAVVPREAGTTSPVQPDDQETQSSSFAGLKAASSFAGIIKAADSSAAPKHTSMESYAQFLLFVSVILFMLS